MIDGVFDCHLHIEKGLDQYDLPLVNGNIIFNQVESYRKYAAQYNNFFHSLIFDYKNNFEFVAACAIERKISALKIHSRLQQISSADYPMLIASLKKMATNTPVIYDAFYYNSDLEYQPDLSALITLATTFPNTKFIVAHAGGYNVLQYFFHLRDLKNIAYDLSFSLQYLEDSSCYADLVKLVKYTSKDKLFFGTDYPSAAPVKQFGILTAILQQLKLSDQETEDIFCNNWIRYVNS